MVIFEQWIEKQFSKANHEPESAINLAELYWQGMDPDFQFFSISFSLKSLSSIIVKVLDLGEIQWFRGPTIRDFKGHWLLMGRVSCQELKVNLLPRFEQHLCSSKFVSYLRLLTDIELKTKWLNRCSSHRWFFESI